MAKMKFRLRIWGRTRSGVHKTTQTCRIGLNCNCIEKMYKGVFQGADRLIVSGVECHLKLYSQTKDSKLLLGVAFRPYFFIEIST
jgi:hypothetical protein